MALRTDRKDTPDRQPGEPFEPQDQAAVSAQPAQCHAAVGCAQPLGPAADFANALKTVDHRGGFDAFLLKAKDAELSPRVLELKREVVKKRKATA